MTVDGVELSVGDADHQFTIQSISKLLMYGFVLETHGRAEVLAKVGVAPTGDPFNAIELDEDPSRAPNPMVNAGAIAITDLVPGDDLDERVENVRAMYHRYLGRRPDLDRSVWASERATGNHNRAIAYLMLSQGIITDRVEETLDLYFAQCSVLVDTVDLATIAAAIANHGVHPVSGEQRGRARRHPRSADGGTHLRHVRLRRRMGVLGRDPGEEWRGRRDHRDPARGRRHRGVLPTARRARQQRPGAAGVRGTREEVRTPPLRPRPTVAPIGVNGVRSG